jgi:23S rRNA pseudouridine2457 synthase
VQVEGKPTQDELARLCDGVIIENRKTLPAKVLVIEDPGFPARVPPVRERKNIPVSWLSIIITEGRNRQVRKMTALIGNPTLRLFRIRIKNISINNIKPGEVRELSEKEISELKK